MTYWNNAIKKALELLKEKDKYCYFYGAKGQVLTKAMMDKLWKQYPSYFARYTAEQKKEIYKFSLGKIGLDCSGFVCYCANIPQAYSGRLITEASKTMTPAETPEAGLLWKQGHVGLDIGHGFYLHMGREMYSVEIGRHKDNPNYWTKGGLLKGVDYNGARNI